MSDSKPNHEATGTDWTKLLADPVLAQHLGKLLQTYRDAPTEGKEEALLAAMRSIKLEPSTASSQSSASSKSDSATLHPQTRPSPASSVPPFEPDVFTPNTGQDRRRHPRIRCFVAVEMRVDHASAPIWGNLSNTSLGGCQVETAHHISSGIQVEIGLWVASGKIWVKGFALNGVVTGTSTAGGVRIRFAAMDPTEKQSLREFLKYVQETTKASKSENSYLELLRK